METRQTTKSSWRINPTVANGCHDWRENWKMKRRSCRVEHKMESYLKLTYYKLSIWTWFFSSTAQRSSWDEEMPEPAWTDAWSAGAQHNYLPAAITIMLTYCIRFCLWLTFFFVWCLFRFCPAHVASVCASHSWVIHCGFMFIMCP